MERAFGGKLSFAVVCRPDIIFNYSQVVLVFTMLDMDEKNVKKRMKARGGKTDEELGEI